MNFLLYVALFGLFFAQISCISMVSITGHIFTRHPAFSRAIMFTLFTIVYNCYLKSIWKVPLPEPMTGFALPSGHAHTMIIFWGWLAIEARSIVFTAFFIAIALLQGYGLLYQGYHYPIDIAAAWGYGAISLLLFYLLHKQVKWIGNRPELFGLLLSGFCLLLIAIMPEEQRAIKYVWQAHGALIGWIMGLMMCHKIKPSPLKEDAFEKLTSLVLLFGVLSVFFVMTNKPQDALPYRSFEFIKYFMLAFLAASWPMWVETIKKYLPKRR